MDYNYHAHTTRCSHATGTEESYIETAIAGGIRYMGFSDHMPHVFPDGYQSGYRVPFEQGHEYVNFIRTLRDKYSGKIELNVGFEMEYYPDYFAEMLQNAKDFGAEFLILGHHFLRQEYPNGHGVTHATSSDEDLEEYVSQVISAMETGVFTYVAHPDSLNFVGDEEQYRKQMRRICIRARELRIPLEINFLGIRRGRHYPVERFWQIAGEEQSPVTFGFDVHETEAACDIKSLPVAMELVERYHLNYIGRPQLRPL
ncbi:MAG: histidinol-phosphatase [Oscillospiraceae bacterium]|nr:histidinol-phosphatase [Oscillospiraceae bacterium]